MSFWPWPFSSEPKRLPPPTPRKSRAVTEAERWLERYLGPERWMEAAHRQQAKAAQFECVAVVLSSIGYALIWYFA